MKIMSFFNKMQKTNTTSTLQLLRLLHISMPSSQGLSPKTQYPHYKTALRIQKVPFLFGMTQKHLGKSIHNLVFQTKQSLEKNFFQQLGGSVTQSHLRQETALDQLFKLSAILKLNEQDMLAQVISCNPLYKIYSRMLIQSHQLNKKCLQQLKQTTLLPSGSGPDVWQILY